MTEKDMKKVVGGAISNKSEEGMFTGDEYLESLNDGREIWIGGEKVKDVTTHPAFRNSARMMARLYDSLHDPENAEILTIPMDDGSGRRTHRFFQAPRNAEEQVAARDAITHWARQSYGWMGRTPDYKAGWMATLGASGNFYGEFQENADRWYDLGRIYVPHLNHAIVNPPIDRHLPNESSDVFVQVEKETDAGLIVSGAKVVATGAALSQYTFVAHYNTVYKDKKFSPIFVVDSGAPGVRLICRNSYELDAAVRSQPFDTPLSSRMDENDSILIFDNVLVPWENVFNYSADGANLFMQVSGNFNRSLLQACTRMAVKLDFIAGLYIRAVEIIGCNKFRGVQAAVGEVISIRHLMWSLSDAMACSSESWDDSDYVLPNMEAALAFRTQAGEAYSKVRSLIYKTIGSSLIYLPSSTHDLNNPALRPDIDKYVRGVEGVDAEERIKVLKLLWDAISSEFGSRHELYELNYSGSNEQTKVDPYILGGISGRNEELKAFAEKCMSEYDLNGWTVPDLINPTDVNTIYGSKG